MPKQNFNEKLTALLKTHPDFLLLLTDNQENENPFWDALSAALTTLK